MLLYFRLALIALFVSVLGYNRDGLILFAGICLLLWTGRKFDTFMREI